jgi:hypothetical protein
MISKYSGCHHFLTSTNAVRTRLQLAEGQRDDAALRNNCTSPREEQLNMYHIYKLEINFPNFGDKRLLQLSELVEAQNELVASHDRVCKA